MSKSLRFDLIKSTAIKYEIKEEVGIPNVTFPELQDKSILD